ncbi:Fructosamine kinase-domain-containing protein [Hypoxylon trugodes]|uniref:Fructosamine kinase-domain-containing protein n=1 Tax=Hypoxylon trugodes TaxID=326681 RepID=UPI00218F8B9A|nr:Fructosamine kinase-domain-containing protein [Hypoxylon trugodes]KAI1382982.1 Fructosamine kinase-domain-containing protein [Hypoxylon trugodes]
MDRNSSDGINPDRRDTKIDPAVLAKLPEDATVLSTEDHGTSFWAITKRINIRLNDGSQASFFMKALSGDTGKKMVESEYESMKAIYEILPTFAPKPIAHGTYQTAKDTHFFLCEFCEMLGDMPNPHKFSMRLAELHQKSESPTRKFGFHMPTYSGNLPQWTEWEDSWEALFAKNLRMALDLEIKVRGYDPEFDVFVPAIFDRVIPRLLRPLESDGRSIKPSLVHGDLWYANSGIDVNTDNPLIFDACCFYAHNEYEFGQWRPTCNKFGVEYLEAYHNYVKISAPEEDYDGRLDLYKLRLNTHVSALFPQNLTLREQMLGDMKDLVQRYT